MIPSYQGHDAKQDDKGRIGRTLHGRDTRFSPKKVPLTSKFDDFCFPGALILPPSKGSLWSGMISIIDGMLAFWRRRKQSIFRNQESIPNYPFQFNRTVLRARNIMQTLVFFLPIFHSLPFCWGFRQRVVFFSSQEMSSPWR